jgi:hypothetical protein
MPWTVNPDHGYLDWKDNPGGGGVDIQEINVDAATAPGTDPVVATAGGEITITGNQVASGTTVNAVRTHSTAANSLTVEVQRSTAEAASTVGSNGISHFDSSSFAVDANGFVTLLGTSAAIDSVGVDAASGTGTDPVMPDGDGLITVTGGQVATGTVGANVIRTHSTAANTYTIEVQRSTAVAATDATKNGVSHFDSAAFTVDANGFVSLIGGSAAIDSINVDASTVPGTDPVLPNGSGQITVTGGQVATGTIGANVIRTNSTAANTYTVEIQRTTTAAAADSTLNGVSHFDSTSFGVDANGFVTLSTGGFTWNDVSGAFSPLKNNGYFITGTATGTLPAVPAQGDIIKFFVDHATQVLTIDAPGTQIIRLGTLVSSAGGTAVSTAHGDSVELVYRASDTCWCAIAGFTGTWIMS